MHFNQWKGAHVVGQTNCGCNSFGGLSDFLVASSQFCLCILKNLISGVNAKEFDLLLDSVALRTPSHSSFGSGLKRKCKVDKSLNVLTDSFMLPSSSAETPSTHSADSWKHVTHWFPVLSARFTLRIILHLNFGNSC